MKRHLWRAVCIQIYFPRKRSNFPLTVTFSFNFTVRITPDSGKGSSLPTPPPPPPISSPPLEIDEEEKEDKNPFQCLHCDTRYRTETELENHMNKDHQCYLCGEVFKKRAMLIRHCVVKHPKKPGKTTGGKKPLPPPSMQTAPAASQKPPQVRHISVLEIGTSSSSQGE